MATGKFNTCFPNANSSSGGVTSFLMVLQAAALHTVPLPVRVPRGLMQGMSELGTDRQ